MSDDTTLNLGSGGDKIVTDEQGDGSKVQVVHAGFGPKGATQRVDTGTPLPVVDASVATLQTAEHGDLAALLAQLTTFTGADHTDLAALLTALGPIATQTTLAALLSRLSAATPTNLPGTAGLAVTGDTTLLGFSARETSGTATAFFRLRAGGVGGAILATVTLAASESVRDWFGPSGITATGGVYFELVTGAVAGGVQTR